MQEKLKLNPWPKNAPPPGVDFPLAFRLAEVLPPEALALRHPAIPPDLPRAEAAAAALKAWELGMPAVRRFTVRKQIAVLPHPFCPIRPEDILEEGDELVQFYDLAAVLRSGQPVAGLEELPAVGNFPDYFAPLPSPSVLEALLPLPLPPLEELWELLRMSPYVVALSAWPHERWGVMHDPSGREPIPREAAVLLRRAGLLEGLSQGIYPATALLLDGEGRLWQGSFARVMEAVETQPQIEDFRNYLRHGALLPPDFSFFSGKAPDPSEEDEDDEEQPGIQFDIEDASELDLPPIPPQGVRERALLRQALRKLEEHPGPSSNPG